MAQGTGNMVLNILSRFRSGVNKSDSSLVVHVTGNYSLKPSQRDDSMSPNLAAPLATAAIIVVLSKN